MIKEAARKVDRRYSSVARSIWNHPKFRGLPGPKPNPQTLLFRLLIAPEATSIPGLFQAFRGGLCDALGWKPSDFEKCFAQLSNDGWVEADWKSGLVWVPGAIEQDGNQPANPNVVRSWRGPITELPDCDLKEKALKEIATWVEQKGEAWAKAISEALGKRRPNPSPNPSGKSLPKPLVKALPTPSPIQEQEQEQEQEQDASKLASGRASRFGKSPRQAGSQPSPRKDPLGERLPFSRWFPSQQWLDWFVEAGITQEIQDRTLVEARDKLTGLHDIEWWDMKILRFFESSLARIVVSSSGSDATPAENERRAAERQAAEDAAKTEARRRLGLGGA